MIRKQDNPNSRPASSAGLFKKIAKAFSWDIIPHKTGSGGVSSGNVGLKLAEAEAELATAEAEAEAANIELRNLIDQISLITNQNADLSAKIQEGLEEAESRVGMFADASQVEGFKKTLYSLLDDITTLNQSERKLTAQLEKEERMLSRQAAEQKHEFELRDLHYNVAVLSQELKNLEARANELEITIDTQRTLVSNLKKANQKIIGTFGDQINEYGEWVGRPSELDHIVKLQARAGVHTKEIRDCEALLEKNKTELESCIATIPSLRAKKQKAETALEVEQSFQLAAAKERNRADITALQLMIQEKEKRLQWFTSSLKNMEEQKAKEEILINEAHGALSELATLKPGQDFSVLKGNKNPKVLERLSEVEAATALLNKTNRQISFIKNEIAIFNRDIADLRKELSDLG